MNHPDLIDRARILRNQPTEPEKRLWRHLSGSRLGGFKFRRQAVVGAIIADFLCPSKALIIELDGDTHDEERDARRDAWSASEGYVTLRFTNADVMRNMEGVLTAILEMAHATPDRWPHPNPSPEGEGLEQIRRLPPRREGS